MIIENLAVASWKYLGDVDEFALFDKSEHLITFISPKDLTFMTDMIALGKTCGSFNREVGPRGDF
jgi:hypothetical protein